MEKYESLITVEFQFAGRVPAPYSTSPLFAENILKGDTLWNDPGTAGNLILQKILAEQGVEDQDDSKIQTRTAELKTHDERMAFQKLVGLPPYSDLTNAVAILMIGLENAARLINVKTISATPLPSGETIISTRQAQRRLYFMNQHGICFTVDSNFLIAVDKLEDAKFFATEEELDAAGVERWGENGTGRWRVLVAPIGEEICGLFEFGEMTSLGKRPEGRINELSL